jgi:hypothetical protein
MRLRTSYKEQWIEIEGEVPGEKAEFLVRPMTPRQINALIKQSTESEWEKNQRFTDINFYKFKIKKINLIIQDWKGIEDENGTPMECDLKNKEIIYIYNVDLIDKVLDMADKLAEIHLKEQEDIEKNLLDGLNGQPKRES